MTITHDERRPFRVAICGAGPGGLLLAVTIGKYCEDTPIDLYEAQPEISVVGAGITLRKRTLGIIEDLGLLEELNKFVTNINKTDRGLRHRIADNRDGGEEWFRLTYRNGAPSSMHRRALVDILKASLPPTCTVHTSKRLKSYQEDSTGTLTLEFTDGITALADVLIGADGIRSPTRRSLFETAAQHTPPLFNTAHLSNYVNPLFSGIMVYRSLFPIKDLLEKYPDHPLTNDLVLWFGQDKHLVAYGVNNGKTVNVIAYTTNSITQTKASPDKWVENVPRNEVADTFSNFEPMARAVAECCEDISLWALHITSELPISTYGHVALLGDACHAMTPHLGAGAGQAMEDAYVLGRLLSHAAVNTQNIPRALRIYQDVRLHYAQHIAADSLANGFSYSFQGPEQINAPRTKENLEAWSNIMKKRGLEYMDAPGSAVEDWLEAKRRLDQTLETGQ
ncbi:FAD/NAD(P)-binding domain-containing protein [Coniophora puteana RWD-64-598 SS2]|uniref:FAD/NAD(P)-binding domain-containing protein n=1 Tax=Coniophora puteana (strain RWD-64-598) TaxID=741705 RepID=A0A5M3ML36_CONPW|nr:FAD/NAD(P)-binding domain-containing protein [Coniophora puteana RWD-64-598 SS2]EIW79727.1 FAD/NAD(P)-binding domain-containing protein [Coniophora puteana RWD-64-598 SS2]